MLQAVKMTGRTGVEMEALTVVLCCITDRAGNGESAEKDDEGQYPITSITDIRVVEKKKGKKKGK